jgi:hypothetical protein
VEEKAVRTSSPSLLPHPEKTTSRKVRKFSLKMMHIAAHHFQLLVHLYLEFLLDYL